MMQAIDFVQKRFANERGAEIVEWVLWVGGIAILAGTLYTVVSGALSNTATNIITGITAISSS
jgi:hypothetical protein